MSKSLEKLSDKYELKGFKTLIVDDLKVNRTLARIILHAMNIDTYEAGNGIEAVNYFSSLKPDLVLMDICMPEMGGIEAMERIRASHDEGKDIPIIAFTSGDHSCTEQDLIKMGFSEYLKKPFQKKEFFDKISVYFPFVESKVLSPTIDATTI